MDRNKSLETIATTGTTTMKDTLYGITGTRGKLSLFPATIAQCHWRHLSNYRRTIIRRTDRNNEDIVEQYHDLNKHEQRRVIQGDTWTGETWFRVNKPPAQPAPTTAKTTEKTEKASQAIQTRHQSTTLRVPDRDGTTLQANREPLYRHTTKKPAPMTMAVPDPSTMTPTTDYWIREGHYWKRVHVQARTTMYVPTTDR